MTVGLRHPATDPFLSLLATDDRKYRALVAATLAVSPSHP